MKRMIGIRRLDSEVSAQKDFFPDCPRAMIVKVPGG
jgi:hypothetical protein